MIRAGDWWNRTQVVRQNVNIYKIIIIIIINQKSEVKSDESKYDKTSSTNPVAKQDNELLSWHLIIITTRLTQLSRYVN